MWSSTDADRNALTPCEPAPADVSGLERARNRSASQVRYRRNYLAGEKLVQAGAVADGLTVILSGRVEISQTDNAGNHVPIVTHGAGAFMGELAQLSGHPSLVNATAKNVVEALIISPDRLRALMVAEADLGERIMRALILRRVGLIETGTGGPVIIGRAENGDVLRLEGFLSRNGHPRRKTRSRVIPIRMPKR